MTRQNYSSSPYAQHEKSTCIILAGGQSTRMGKNKALLPLPGKEYTTFVEHLASLFTSLDLEVLIVARNEKNASEYSAIEASIIVDKIPDHGPLMGLYSGLSAMKTERALVVAVDMPCIQPALVSFLLSQPVPNTLIVPLVNTVPQVLLAVYPRTLLPFIEEALRQGRRDPRSLLQLVPVHYLEEAQLREVDPELRSFINVNTLTDLENLEHRPLT